MKTTKERKFVSYTTISIPPAYGQGIGDWLVERFLEKFWNDELIESYLLSWRKSYDISKYITLAIGEMEGGTEGRISIKEYQEFLDELYKILPKKFRKTWSAGKPWFKNVMPIVDLGMWPLTFEAADKKREEISLAITKWKKDKWVQSPVATHLDSLESPK